MKIKQRVLYNLAQIPGWHTDRRIVVIESDDWGSIRMRSGEAIKQLRKLGLKITDPFNQYDALASEEDLSCLFEVLTKFKDREGNHPVITANTIMANPDFKKIQESDFKEYHFELFTDTLQKYPDHKGSFMLWKEGMKNKVFHPQYHGREHVNIFRWLRALKSSENAVKKGFDHQVFGLREEKGSFRDSFMRALDFQNKEQLEILEKNLLEGLELFKNVFGYASRSFIAPSYVWNEQIEQKLALNQVKYLQGIAYQYIPKIGKEALQKEIHYTGQRNQYRQIYLIRNAFFEPSLYKKKTIEETLNRIEIAFRWNKPAIIGSHRINYIGYLEKRNRDENLILLRDILKVISKKWPEVEFMTTDQLGDLITGNNM